MDATRVEQNISARHFGAFERTRMTFVYDIKDPYAVKIEFDTENSWVFARQLLSEILTDGAPSAGLGDIRFSRLTDENICMAMTSPDGEAQLVFPTASLMLFLKKTYNVVKRDYEEVDVQSWIDDLMKETNEW